MECEGEDFLVRLEDREGIGDFVDFRDAFDGSGDFLDTGKKKEV
jgi:hypothetical protein